MQSANNSPTSKQAETLPTFETLTSSRDAEKVQAVIVRTWGFTPTLDYCRHLIDFVEGCTDGQ